MEFNEIFELLNTITENKEQTDLPLPEYVRDLISAGAIFMDHEPDFFKAEFNEQYEPSVALEESVWPDKSLTDHFNKHVYKTSERNPNGKQDLYRLEHAPEDFTYLFPATMTKEEFKAAAEDLIAAKPSENVGCYLCQDPKHLTDEQNQRLNATSKFGTGETRTERASTFRICKYRLNPELKIPAANLFYADPNTGKVDNHPAKDFVYADHGVYEVVYYTYTAFYDLKNNLEKSDVNTLIQSYFLKTEAKVLADRAAAERAYANDKTMRLYSNKMNLDKLGETSTRQAVCVVLEFVPGSVPGIKVTLFNNAVEAQEYYRDHLLAFMPCIFNGSKYNLLKSNIYQIKDSYRKQCLIDASNKTENAAPRIEKLMNRFNGEIQQLEFEPASIATDADIIAFLNDAVDEIEKRYVKSTGHFASDLYKRDLKTYGSLTLYR